MIERVLTKLFEPARYVLTEKRLRERNIKVVEVGNKPITGMVLFTHSTIEDTSLLRSSLPDAVTVVNAEALRKTQYERVNRVRARVISAMIPAYKDSKEDRMHTYAAGASVVDSGRLLAIAPTGGSTLSAEIPSPDELHFGGTIRILQKSARNNTFVTPVVCYVEQKDITEEGTIANSSTVHMLYCDRVEVPASMQTAGQVPEEDVQVFAQNVCSAWENAVRNFTQTTAVSATNT